MNYRVTLRRDGTKLSIDLPPEAEAALGAAAGETLTMIVDQNGEAHLKRDAVFARAMAAASETHEKYGETLRDLAK